jgi:hypothetical protein
VEIQADEHQQGKHYGVTGDQNGVGFHGDKFNL